MTEQKKDLMGLDLEAMKAYFIEIGEPAYRAGQMMKWIHFFGVSDFNLMTNFSKTLRQHFQETATINLPECAREQISTDGTRKWLVKLTCGSCIETVYIPEEGRGTLCVSSQVGCALNCSFCSTGKQGFSRNLSSAEIISQVWFAVRRLSEDEGKHDHRVTNVVMMGMGEPLLNFDNVVSAMNLMLDDNAYGLSKYRVTLSTSGVIPAMKALAKVSNVALAVSLHAPNDELRNELVPINKKYPIADLMAVCRNYFADEPRRTVTFEYVMLNDVNDSPLHAKQLVKCLQGVPAKVNLIPFNPIPGADYVCSSKRRIDAFRDILIKAGVNTITRKTRGDDIDAACGQLAGEVRDKTSRSARLRAQRQMMPTEKEVYA